MKRAWLLPFVSITATLAGVGCARITTRVVEKPRVDQEIQGNRGYLTGSSSAPAASQRKGTRQMIETHVELPTLDELNPWKKPAPAAEKTAQAPLSPPARAAEIPGAWQEPVSTPGWEEEPPARIVQPVSPRLEPLRPSGTTYTVQKGDSLEKIASKFYGSSRKWRRIYEANRNVIKNPDRVRAGQKLLIPDIEEAAPARSQTGIK